MKCLFFLLFACSSFLVAEESHSPHWAVKSIEEGWKNAFFVKKYFHNSELQRQWAWEVLPKAQFKGDEKILDFGCGDGKISAEIARLVPHGQVIGVDLSDEMIFFAKHKFPKSNFSNLAFLLTKKADFSDFQGDKDFDAMVSFCCFHLVPDPEAIVKNLVDHLKPGGKFFFVIPAGRNPLFFKAAEDTFTKHQSKAPWQQSVNSPNALTMRTVEGCETILKACGCEVQECALVDSVTPFIDEEEFIAFLIGTTMANWNIPAEKSEAFCRDLAKRMLELDPALKDSDGVFNFKLAHINVIAKKSAATVKIDQSHESSDNE